MPVRFRQAGEKYLIKIKITYTTVLMELGREGQHNFCRVGALGQCSSDFNPCPFLAIDAIKNKNKS
jgi:hypothetical protein